MIKFFYLGIDIGKNFHIASLIAEKKNVNFKGFQFKNTTDDVNLLLEMLISFRLILGVILQKFARIKTDKIDSLIIADFIRYIEYSETSFAFEEILEVRNLSRLRISLVDSIGDLKRKIICVLYPNFP